MPLVLVVDDDAGMVDTLGDILSTSGHEVAWAPNGREAVAMVGKAPYDVVLMDIQMPELNGVEALKAMKQVAPETPVIMMTAYTRDELMEEARRADPIAVLPKPLDVERVLALIAEAGGARRSPATQ